MEEQEQQEENNQEVVELGPIEALENERDEYKALAQRAQADLINFRRRVDDERKSLHQNASNNLIVKLLPIADDLHRALSLIPADTGSWVEGVKMVVQNLDASIESTGVSKITPGSGDSFDPAIHEAIHYLPNNDYPPGSVIECFRIGYRSADRILRAAQVVVAQEIDKASEPNNDE